MNGPVRFPDASIVIVDDEPSNVAVLERMLAGAGYRNIRATTDSATLLAMLEESDADIVLLDLMMPPPDGYDILAKLAALGDWHRARPVLVLTADATREALERALGLGARDFLTKPFDRREVLLRMENLIETRLLYRALEEENIDLSAKLAAQQAAEAHIREAQGRIDSVLRDGGLSIVFQPIRELETRAVVGREALARFAAEPRRPPDVWFEEAAMVGSAETLELMAAMTAVRAAASLPADQYVAINASPLTIASDALEPVLGLLPPERIVVEVTEHEQVGDYDAVLERLAGFRAAGGRLAIDDAGAGFSSLRHVLLLQPDLVKLDISLTRDIHRDRAKRALASGLISFADEMGMTIVAEGIETEDELATLLELGVRVGQGYLLGRPAALGPASANWEAGAPRRL